MMSDDGLPDEIIQRFRQLAAERLTRAESLWFGLLQGTAREQDAAELHRLIHTLKGDAQMIGFSDVELVCHELEELLAVAQGLAYTVPDDVDLLVTMSFHFIGLLARKRAGTSVAGIDLDGFVQEVAAAVLAAQAPTGEPTDAVPTAPPDPVRDQGQRLARAATVAFLEQLGARGASHERLRELWRILQQEVAQLSSTSLGALVERHLEGARELGEQLGKLVVAGCDTHGLCVSSRVADAVDVGLLHCIRNALDHGLEPPDQRTTAGKPPHGALRITASTEGDGVEIVVEDDGRGLDLDAIARRAHEAGLIDGPSRASVSPMEARELLFRPGFSTVQQPSHVSGRGVGLDAVRSALHTVGGEVTVHDRPGGGTRFVMRVPARQAQLGVHVFEVRPGISIAVPAHWTLTPEPAPGSAGVDPLEALGVAERSASAPAHRVHVMTLRWGQLHASWAVTTLPRLTTAARICPTAPTDPMEVVDVQGHEVLVLRPELLSGAAAATATASPSPPRAV